MNKFPLQSLGKIQYDPHRPGLRTKNKWWCIVNTDNDLAEYYRWFLQREYHIQTLPPSWGSHISIIRGEQPHKTQLNLWRRYQDREVTFEFDHNIYGNGEFWWIEVYHPLFTTIRNQFGFPSNWGQHLTIARTHPNWPVDKRHWCLKHDPYY